MKTAAEIRAEGEALTRAQLEATCAKFRAEIGGVYDYVAACIEQQHPHLTGETQAA